MEREEIARKLIDDKLYLSEFTRRLEAYGVYVVQPGDIVTSDFRMDYKRFFPELDENGIVVSGGFG